MAGFSLPSAFQPPTIASSWLNAVVKWLKRGLRKVEGLAPGDKGPTKEEEINESMGKHTWTGPKGKCGQIPRKKYILSCISP